MTGPEPRPDRWRDLGRLLLGHLRSRRDARLQDVATRLLRTDGDSRVLAVVNGTLRARAAVAYRLRLEPRRRLSRRRFARSPAHGAVPHRVLSLLCPTRGRVGGLDNFLRSLHRTAASPGRVEVLCYVDSDDPHLPAYRSLFADSRVRYPGLGRCVLHVGAPDGVPEAWNELARQARGDLLMMANDDQLYVDHGWDAVLDRRADELTLLHGDDLLCLYFDGGQYDGGCDFPIVTRAWFDQLGYFVPTIFQQWEVETWVFDIARRVGRLHAVPGIFVEHLHYQDYKAPFDETYQRHRMTREKSLTDHALFLRTEPDRQAAATAMLDAIERRTTRPAPAGPVPPPGYEPWFLDHIDAHRARILEEAQAWAAGRHGPWHEVDLVGAAGPAGFPVTVDVLASVPEVVASGTGSAVVAALGPGERHRCAGSPDAGGTTVHVWLRAGAGVELRAADRTEPAGVGQPVVLPGGVGYEVHNGGDDVASMLILGVPAEATAGRVGG